MRKPEYPVFNPDGTIVAAVVLDGHRRPDLEQAVDAAIRGDLLTTLRLLAASDNLTRRIRMALINE